jgi:hypothetical protein
MIGPVLALDEGISTAYHMESGDDRTRRRDGVSAEEIRGEWAGGETGSGELAGGAVELV